ncbi:hypothetical protein D3C86_1283390 [compost metagenome]
MTANPVLEELAVVELSEANQQTFTLGVDDFKRHPGRTRLSPQVLQEQQVQVGIAFQIILRTGWELWAFGGLVLEYRNAVAVPQVVREEGELLRNVLEDVLAFEEGELLRIRSVLVELVFVTNVSSSNDQVVGASSQVRHLHQHLRLRSGRTQGVSVGTGVTDLVLVVDTFDGVSDEHTEGIDLEQVREDALDELALVVDERHGLQQRLLLFLLHVRHVAELIEPLVTRHHSRVGQNQLLLFSQIQTHQFRELHSQLVQALQRHRSFGVVEVSTGQIAGHDAQDHEVGNQ